MLTLWDGCAGSTERGEGGEGLTRLYWGEMQLNLRGRAGHKDPEPRKKRNENTSG